MLQDLVSRFSRATGTLVWWFNVNNFNARVVLVVAMIHVWK
jgi:hypothetical protein